MKTSFKLIKVHDYFQVWVKKFKLKQVTDGEIIYTEEKQKLVFTGSIADCKIYIEMFEKGYI